MTLFTLASKKQKSGWKAVGIYAGVTLFCVVFFLIYDRFSHGVRSPYMTFLFAWPLVLGLVPSFIWMRFHLRWPGMWAANLYHSGVACLTVSSMLRGIFDIAGNASDYQQWLMIAGFLFLAGGIIVYCFKR